jgi:hypothetical protein
MVTQGIEPCRVQKSLPNKAIVTKGFEKEILTIESLITSQRMCRSCDPSNVLLDSDVSGIQRKGKAG